MTSEMLNIYASNIVINCVEHFTFLPSHPLLAAYVCMHMCVCVCTCDISVSSLANKEKHGLIINREKQRIK